MLIGFSTSNAWYSRAIRFFTKSRCSHTFLVVSILGTWVVLEEGFFGYMARTLDDLRKHDTIVALYRPRHSIRAGVKASLTDLGQPYDYLGLIGMAFVMLGRRLGKKWSNPLASTHAMICSERVTRVLQGSNYPFTERYEPASTTPEDLLEFLECEHK